MIKHVPLHVSLLTKRLALLLIPYELTRIIFRVYNAAYFSGLPFSKLCLYMITGLRFDISAILITNAVFISLSLMPWGSEQSFFRRIILKMIYMLVNSICFFFQIGDTVFFPYVYKRSTGDIFKFLGLGDDTADIMPTVIKDYWYMILIWFLLIALIYVMYTRAGRKSIRDSKIEQKHPVTSFTIASYVVFLGLIIMGCRGGWQLRSIDTVDAGDIAPPHDIPLVMNSPFSILITYYRPVLVDKKLSSDSVKVFNYTPIRLAKSGKFRKLNVVTIIMESMSKEFIGSLNNSHHTHTPFLDSLISQSLVFDDAYSDGKKSIEGIPAVVASLPSWMNTSFITSPYTDDQSTCLAGLLDKEGYTTAFFHGGHNGTMGFDKFCEKGGFRYYYGMKEYPNKTDYDGNWGIWDEPFFQYFAKNLDTLHQPFYAAIFSISSHHPFSIPEKYKKKFVQKKGEQPILKCVEYSDYSLKEFFEAASKMPWYDSTIFVITADHAGPSVDPYYSNRLGMYQIPIIYYMPHSNLKGVSHITTQQIDIMPSLLDYMNYPESYFSYGESVFDSTLASHHFAINFLNDVYEINKFPYCLQMVGNKVEGLYNYQKDGMLKDNLADKQPRLKVEDTLSGILRKVIETYNYSVIHNQMQIKKGGT